MFRDVSIFKKLILANFFYAGPVLVLVYLMVAAQNVNIDFGTWELKGNKVQRPMEDILRAVSEHKILAQRHLYLKTADTSALKDAESRADKGFESLNGALAEVGEDLQFTNEGLTKRKREGSAPDLIQKRWTELKTQWTSMSPADAVAAHTKLITDLRTIIAHAGDTSNLILDPDLDSYYLMDVTLLALPQMQDRLQDIISSLEGLVRTKTITQEDRVRIAVYGALLKQSDLDRVTADIDTVLNEDPNFYGESPTLRSRLKPAIDNLAGKVGAFVELLNKMSTSAPGSITADEFLNVGSSALQSSHDTWTVSVDELDVLLNNRVSVLSSAKWRSLIWALLALAISCGLLLWIARSFNSNITKVLVSLKQALDQTREFGSRLVSISDNLNSSSTSQASAIQETVSTLDEINAMVGKTLEGAEHTRRTAEESDRVVAQGKNAVQKVRASMEDISRSSSDIQSQIEASNSQISEITKIISDIAAKTKVINDIVFQTKLLSFNASVEAARAGESGKGFAVVAEEVGNLAGMSGGASKEIAELVDASTRKVESIVTQTKGSVEALIQNSSSRVQAGTSVTEECGRALDQIVDAVRRVQHEVESITAAAQEQAKGVQEITKAMRKMDEMTQQNASMSNQTASHSKNLASQADKLAEIVATLEKEVLGKSVQQASAPESISEAADVMPRFKKLGRERSPDEISQKLRKISDRRSR